jgi:hypothetical protein
MALPLACVVEGSVGGNPLRRRRKTSCQPPFGTGFMTWLVEKSYRIQVVREHEQLDEY